MKKILVMIHVVPGLREIFSRLADELLPDVLTIDITDTVLNHDLMTSGAITPRIRRRIADHAVYARELGADVVLVTCSSLAVAVDSVRPFVSVPLLRVDEAMAEAAVLAGSKIAVLATAPTTLRTTVEIIEEKGALLGKNVQVQSFLCQGAYAPMLAGKMDLHDKIVMETMKEASAKADVLVLAQASMAHLENRAGELPRLLPVLTCPRLAIENVRKFLTEPM